ncbi:MAG: DUF58 domain-containing protein [Clostridia bacterium]|nr:DUF58 domain-containing protein [Clostridia bacterium]
MDYITKIKANISIYSNKKTMNVLDGSYRSIYKGRSMNFEDLREYVMGDNVKDIDWKASARSGNLLVRQFIAEKKHNIMIVMDTGKKMLADTKLNESKSNVALMSAGTIAYLANKNGDYVGSVYGKNNKITYFPFKSDLNSIEKILTSYNKDIQTSSESSLQQSLEYISKYVKKKMIIFVITDIDGIQNVQERTLKNLTTMHDVLFVNITDADITNNMAFDVERELYIPKLIFSDKKLHELESKLKEQIYKNWENKLKRYGIFMISLNSNKEIPTKVIELLERHRVGK